MDPTSESWTAETRAAFLEGLERYPASATYLRSSDATTSPTARNDAEEIVQVSTALDHARVIQAYVHQATGVSLSLELITRSAQEPIPGTVERTSLLASARCHSARRTSPLALLSHTVPDPVTIYDHSQDMLETQDIADALHSSGNDSECPSPKLPANFTRRTSVSGGQDPVSSQSPLFVPSSPGLSVFGNMSLGSPGVTSPSMSRRRLAENIPALRCQVNLSPSSFAPNSTSSLDSPRFLDSPSPASRNNSNNNMTCRIQAEDVVTPVDRIIHTPLQPPVINSPQTEKVGGRWRFASHLTSPMTDYSNLPSPSNLTPAIDSSDYPMGDPLSPLLSPSHETLFSPVQEMSSTPIRHRQFPRSHTPTRPALSLSRRLSYSQAVSRSAFNTPDRASPLCGQPFYASSGLASPLVIRTPGLKDPGAESPLIIPSGIRTYFD